MIWIHSIDAADRALNDGNAVEVGNELGSVQLVAKVTDEIVPGTVLAPGIWWTKFCGDGRNINQVTSQSEADMGGGATFYDVLVWVRKVDVHS